jgi:hypothetical protein
MVLWAASFFHSLLSSEAHRLDTTFAMEARAMAIVLFYAIGISIGGSQDP